MYRRITPAICLVGSLLAAWAYLAADARARSEHLREVSSIRLNETAFIAPWGPKGGATATGPLSNDQILSLSGSDGYQWVVHAEQLHAGGGWRVRRTGIDNAPTGREVHWSSGPIWWLLALASVLRSAGISFDEALETAALFAGPIQYAILLLGIALAIRRRLGWAAACTLPIGVLITPRLAEFFQAGYMDHHGAAAIAGLAVALFAAAAGAGREGDEASSRRWMRASALAGAVGLWISSASTVPVLIGVGLAAVLASIVSAGTPPGKGEPPLFRPELWRDWGRIGAAGSLGFYLLEYFPSSMGMRLEVNHPLYALAWAGAGELIFRGCRWVGGGRWVEDRRDRIIIPASVLALALLPLLIACAPARLFWVSDRFLWTLHQDIGEFHSLRRQLHDYGTLTTLRANTILPLLTIPALAVILRRPGSARMKTMLTLCLIPALLVGLLSWIQVRWAGNQEALWLGLLVTVVSLVTEGGPARPRWSLPAVAGFLALAVFSTWPATLGPTLRGRGPGLQVTLEDQMQLVMRDVARKVRPSDGGPAVVLTGPSATTELIYFGGLRGLGTLYWENRDGLRAAASIYGAATDDEALARIQAHGVTHLVSFSWEDYAEKLGSLYLAGMPGAAPGRPLAERLKSPESLPIWTRPVPYSIPPELGLKGQSVVILEVRPEQTAADHFASLGDYFQQLDALPDAEAAYRRALTADARHAAANLGLARALVRGQNAAGAWRAIEAAAPGTTEDERATQAAEISRLGGQISRLDPRVAIQCYRRAIGLDSRCRAAWNNLAWLLATAPDSAVRDGREATRAAEALIALEAEPDPISLDTLAAALAEAGRWAEATAAATQAVELAERSGRKDVADYRARLELYRAGQPYRQPARKG